MSWEYRVCKEANSISGTLMERMGIIELDEDDRYSFSIREVHYWDSDENKIYLTSEEERAPYGSTLEELKNSVELMLKAFDKPVIDLDKLEYYNPTDEEINAISDDDYEDDGLGKIPF